MLHRTKKKDDQHQGKWNGLGGKMEPGESPEECVIREVKEESGLDIRNPRLRGILTFPSFEQQEEDWYVFVFTVEDFTGTLAESSEGDLAWIEDAKMGSLHTWDGDKIFIPWLDQEKFFSAKFNYANGKLVSHTVSFY